MPIKAIILGTSGGRRFLDSARSYPAILANVGDEKPVLSWIRQAFLEHRISRVTYIGGYHIEKVIRDAPDWSFQFHEKWEQEGELGALKLVKPEAGFDYLVVRGDLVLTADAVATMLSEHGSVLFGQLTHGGQAKQLVGVRVHSDAVEGFFEKLQQLKLEKVSRGLDAVAEAFDDAAIINLDGKAASIDHRPEVLRLVFRGKAKTLEQLSGLVKTARVPPQIRFTVGEWRSQPEIVLKRISCKFEAPFLVVRSSSRAEDQVGKTGAGRFESVLGVDSTDTKKLINAIEQVIRSYQKEARILDVGDELLVQPQITDLVSSGVVFTRDLETRAPCLTVSIDRDSQRSDSVTSGSRALIDTCHVSWNAERSLLPSDIARVSELSHELMGLTQLDALDIEFAFDRANHLHLFQVRPLPRSENAFKLSDQDLLETVQEARRFVADSARAHPLLAGNTTLFGNMPDWNPAEMIGKAPRPLALSLYQSLIGDFNWAQARADIGYRDVTPEPLVISIGGRPYIDVRASLNSFLPADLPDDIAHKWLNYCLERLANLPELHDKVEFEVLPTCLAFDWETHAQRMRDAGLSEDEIHIYRKHLGKLTSRVLSGETPRINDLHVEVEKLEAFRLTRLMDGAESATALARRAHLLLVDCGRYGLRPFSILARYAFISLALLKSLVTHGGLSREAMDSFLQSIPTVAGQFTRDLARYLTAEMSESEFLSNYGHLRPNSYEITSPNYRQAVDRYVRSGSSLGINLSGNNQDTAIEMGEFAETVENQLEELGLPVDSKGLFEFMRQAIAGREKAKFEFMKCVDSILDAVRQFGEQLDLTPDQLSHLHINEILEFARGSMNGSSEAHLKRLASLKKKQMEVTRAFKMPDLIRRPDELMFHTQERWKPNFVTQHCIQAELVDLSQPGDLPSLDGRIVMIQAADPGFDWVFGHRIAGLVTEYGGIGSHMAIRAAEFSLPAAIGCGSVIFDQLRKAQRIEIDCANGVLRVLE